MRAQRAGVQAVVISQPGGQLIGHVAVGYRWFRHVCAARAVDPEAAFGAALGRIGLARPHAPFNEPARRKAGLTPAFDITFSAAGRPVP